MRTIKEIKDKDILKRINNERYYDIEEFDVQF